MKLLVCGGRDYQNFSMLTVELDKIHRETPVTELIHGGAKGADRLAESWANWNLIPTRCFEADWKEQGRGAGPIRNQKMIDQGQPDMVVAFPGGDGTKDMVRRAGTARLPIVEIEPNPRFDNKRLNP